MASLYTRNEVARFQKRFNEEEEKKKKKPVVCSVINEETRYAAWVTDKKKAEHDSFIKRLLYYEILAFCLSAMIAVLANTWELSRVRNACVGLSCFLVLPIWAGVTQWMGIEF